MSLRKIVSEKIINWHVKRASTPHAHEALFCEAKNEETVNCWESVAGNHHSAGVFLQSGPPVLHLHFFHPICFMKARMYTDKACKQLATVQKQIFSIHSYFKSLCIENWCSLYSSSGTPTETPFRAFDVLRIVTVECQFYFLCSTSYQFPSGSYI